MNEQEQQQVNINVQLDKTLPVICEECGNQTFQEGLMLRKISKFLTATAKDSLLPIPTFVCMKCGHVNAEFIPPQLQNLPNE